MSNTTTDTTADAVNAPVLSKLEDGVAHITLNRPDQANALDDATINALAAAINQACDDTGTRVVLLRAIGKTFCAGGDIRMFETRLDELAELLDNLLVPLNKALVRLQTSGLPVVSAINGPVGGGGIGIALCADFVLAADTMKLRCGYSAIGLTPDAGSSWFLAKRTGTVYAKQLFFMNTPLDAQACLQKGIVDAVYPAEQLLDEATALATQLAAAPKHVMQRTKFLVDSAGKLSFEKHLDAERRYMVASGGEAASHEGIKAFIEKRKAVFNNA